MSRSIGFGLALVAVLGTGLGPIAPVHADPAASPAKLSHVSPLFQPSLTVTAQNDHGLIAVTMPAAGGQYSLSMGDGTTLRGADNQPEIYYTYQASGRYLVQLADTDAGGSTGTAAVWVDVTVATAPPLAHAVARISGGDRYATAIAVSRTAWTGGSAKAVVLARGDKYPDALSGVPLAAHVGGPLLLTDPTVLDTATRAEIDRVLGGPASGRTVYILGGTAAISPGVEKGLVSAGYHVVRYSGADRAGTALAVAQQAFTSAPGALIATDTDFADALAAGPLAAALGEPILLTGQWTISDGAWNWLQQHPRVGTVGEPALAVISERAMHGWGNIRANDGFQGPDRYTTALAVAHAMIDQTSGSLPPGRSTGVCFASGETFPDALSGGALCALQNRPMLLLPATGGEGDVLAALDHWNGALSQAELFGGPAALSQTAEDQVAQALSFTEN
ncbi:putative cell wall binding repeat 2-containing protein [Catenulispora acidiphila DSM 44928]|uniref:Putative cell wall binding repeat 2-containing protein n=1 Tax=Catenulispora acidiphila (strain DSM 44928 / JCM 14897 / NBRC 102108 / NRRL B-24433 / ID139908) TaxID=479433 RepID=C7PXA2_CATAD|nr:cell wall-binding repeat-containing protein [Catenulispora acidiphila]ACU69453.1 putative cell wall binding repeat 2-containing protein [Catenulispora acidiphila DSM 44928]